MDAEPFLKNLPPLIGLVVLVIVLLFVLVNFGYLRACDIPGFSGIYYMIKGESRVAMVTGADGTGDPEYLRRVISEQIHIYPTTLDVNMVTDSSALSRFQIVLVEHARTMSTQTLSAFAQYVHQGGKLVWIGDAGTKLGQNDYICEHVSILYRPAAYVQTSQNTTAEQCGDWVTQTPKVPDSSYDGICGKTFGDIVMSFVEENASAYNSIATGQYHLCTAEETPYQISGADSIFSCINTLTKAKKEITADNANELCLYNYWKRGPSRSAANQPIAALDFSQQVLGMDFVKQYGASNLFLTPSGSEHALIKGYESGSNVDFSTYFGVANISLIDTTRFSSVLRTSTILFMNGINDKACPNNICTALAVSNPYPALNRNGLIIYYAFAPDDLIKVGGTGTRLINNLFSFLTC